MKIYAMRHGQTEMNVEGLINGQIGDNLTLEGIEQATQAISLIPKTIKHIYSSSLTRARQTAAILGTALNIDISFHDELREVDFGILQGTPFLDEYKEKHWQLTYDWRPSGEDFDQVKTRVLKVLAEIKANSNDGEALIVAHGGIIRTLHYLESKEIIGDIENGALHSFDLDKILDK
jgi:probable phosphoglycerate mutase